MTSVAEFGEIFFHELIEVSVKHVFHVEPFVVGAVILDAPVVQHVAADLASPLDFFLFALDLAFFGLLFFPLPLVELGHEHFHGTLPVLELRTLLLAADHDSGREVLDAHGGLHLVDVLAALAAAAEGGKFEVLLADFDFNIGRGFRVGEDTGKGGVPPGVRVVRRNANQPVNTVFSFQVAVGIGALDFKCCGFDAGSVTLLVVVGIDFDTPCVPPTACTFDRAFPPSPGPPCRLLRHEW